MEGIGFNLPLLIAFLVNFLILFGLLTFVLYKPILKVLDERAVRIKEGLQQAEQMKDQASRAEQEIKAQIELGRKEAQTIITQAMQSGERIKTEARDEARKEAETVVNRARAEIQQEREQTVDQLRKEFADIAVAAAGKIIKETLDKERHRKIIEEVLEKSPELKG